MRVLVMDEGDCIISQTSAQLMDEREIIPQRSTKPQIWTRRAIQRHLEVTPETLYKWEPKIHASLKKLSHSFKFWLYLQVQGEAKKKKYPPLDDYYIECLLLLGQLRATASANETIADTVKNNEFRFYELHEQFAPKTTPNSNNN